MRPRNKKEIRIMALSGQLRPLTIAQQKWAFSSTIEHFGYRLKTRKTVCMDCGHEWIEERNGIVRCPHCGAILEIKDTKERVLKDKSYFNVITTKEEYQIVRCYMMLVEMRKGIKARPAFLEVCQYWIAPDGTKTVVGLQRSLGGYYIDTFIFGSPLEIRRDNEAFQRISDEWVYPRIKVTDILRRNGFKSTCHAINPVDLFHQLLTNPQAETLMKEGEIQLLRHLIRYPKEVSKYWNSIKVARRNGYEFDNVPMWFDYVKMLETMGKDLNSPKLVAPQDLKAAHDEYVDKVNRQRRKKQQEKERQEAIKDKEQFEQMKSRFFGLTMTDGSIRLHTLDSIEEYFEVGTRNHICCGSSKYYLKPQSLVMVAYIGNEQVATVEISLTNYSVLQCRAFANGVCEYTEQIASIIANNTNLIAERKAA